MCVGGDNKIGLEEQKISKCIAISKYTMPQQYAHAAQFALSAIVKKVIIIYVIIYVLMIWDVTNIIHECNGKKVVIIQSGNYGLLATGENEDIEFAVDTTKQICNNL